MGLAKRAGLLGDCSTGCHGGTAVCPKAYTAKQDTAAVVATRRSGMDWLLMVFFGIGTGAYTLVLAWLPPYYIQLGLDATQSGLMLGD